VIAVPAALVWWRTEPGGADWLARLPRLVDECAARWSLRVGAPLPGGNVALVVAAERRDGTPAVLKLSFPEPESEHEGLALRAWDGDGAVRLLEHDAGRRALLLERAVPGTQAWALDDDEATRAIAGVLRRIGRAPAPGHPFRLLADVARGWAAEVPAVGSAVEELLADATPEVLLHQDLHGGNVLRSGVRWVAIDPKPLVGDPAFDVASLVRDRRPIREARVVERRLDLLVEELGHDRERMRLWSWVHARAWAADEEMLAAARLLDPRRE
jgi:streptomycin 6-kinase